MTETSAEAVSPQGIHHVRLTVTDIVRSKAFYTALLGMEPALDKSDLVDEPGVREDPKQFYGGCVFSFGDQLLGLRPVAKPGDRFESERVGLDHVSLLVKTRTDLDEAIRRLDADGVEHGDVIDIGMMSIVSVQDPDDINLELTYPQG